MRHIQCRLKRLAKSQVVSVVGGGYDIYSTGGFNLRKKKKGVKQS